jgi:general secretion pathway protein D
MRDAATSNSVSLDRYETIRAQQKAEQPRNSWITPINESPVLPPLNTLQDSSKALSAPAPKPIRNPALPAAPASGASAPDPADPAASQPGQ